MELTVPHRLLAHFTTSSTERGITVNSNIVRCQTRAVLSRIGVVNYGFWVVKCRLNHFCRRIASYVLRKAAQNLQLRLLTYAYKSGSMVDKNT
jgi:hypothetical protein